MSLLQGQSIILPIQNINNFSLLLTIMRLPLYEIIKHESHFVICLGVILLFQISLLLKIMRVPHCEIIKHESHFVICLGATTEESTVDSTTGECTVQESVLGTDKRNPYCFSRQKLKLLSHQTVVTRFEKARNPTDKRFGTISKVLRIVTLGPIAHIILLLRLPLYEIIIHYHMLLSVQVP